MLDVLLEQHILTNAAPADTDIFSTAALNKFPPLKARGSFFFIIFFFPFPGNRTKATQIRLTSVSRLEGRKHEAAAVQDSGQRHFLVLMLAVAPHPEQTLHQLHNVFSKALLLAAQGACAPAQGQPSSQGRQLPTGLGIKMI